MAAPGSASPSSPPSSAARADGPRWPTANPAVGPASECGCRSPADGRRRSRRPLQLSSCLHAPRGRMVAVPVAHHLPRPVRTVAVVPAYNEERTVAAVLDRLYPLVDELVVVDDGSVDGTRAAIQAWIAGRYPATPLVF